MRSPPGYSFVQFIPLVGRQRADSVFTHIPKGDHVYRRSQSLFTGGASLCFPSEAAAATSMYYCVGRAALVLGCLSVRQTQHMPSRCHSRCLCLVDVFWRGLMLRRGGVRHPLPQESMSTPLPPAYVDTTGTNLLSKESLAIREM